MKVNYNVELDISQAYLTVPVSDADVAQAKAEFERRVINLQEYRGTVVTKITLTEAVPAPVA